MSMVARALRPSPGLQSLAMPDSLRQHSSRQASARVGVDMSGLDGTVGFMLKRAQIAHSHAMHAAFAEFDVTAVQFSVLTLAANNPGILQAELAAALEVERPRIVPVLDSLERRQLAERRQDEHDGRNRRIHLTEQGATLLDELTNRFQQLEDHLASVLGNQKLKNLLRSLQVIIDLPE